MKPFDVVKVAAISDDRFTNRPPEYLRHPQAGDVGAIVEDYGGAFEVECCEPETGITIWLEAMFADELQAAEGSVQRSQ